MRTKVAERVVEFLEGLGAEVHDRTVTLTPEDREVLDGEARRRTGPEASRETDKYVLARCRSGVRDVGR